MARVYTIETDQWLPRPLDEVFAFFAEAENLQELTPPWLDFTIVSERPIVMREGALIDYRLKVRGVPMRWRSRIAVWEPGRRFVDEQLRGPYKQWIHTHAFEADDGGTRVRDRVEYAVPGGGLVHSLFVKRDVRRIFAYRGERLAELFGGSDPGRLEMGRR